MKKSKIRVLKHLFELVLTLHRSQPFAFVEVTGCDRSVHGGAYVGHCKAVLETDRISRCWDRELSTLPTGGVHSPRT